MGVGQTQIDPTCLGLQAVQEGQRRGHCESKARCLVDEWRPNAQGSRTIGARQGTRRVQDALLGHARKRGTRHPPPNGMRSASCGFGARTERPLHTCASPGCMSNCMSREFLLLTFPRICDIVVVQWVHHRKITLTKISEYIRSCAGCEGAHRRQRRSRTLAAVGHAMPRVHEIVF